MLSDTATRLLLVRRYCLMRYNKATSKEAQLFWINMHVKASKLFDGGENV